MKRDDSIGYRVCTAWYGVSKNTLDTQVLEGKNSCHPRFSGVEALGTHGLGNKNAHKVAPTLFVLGGKNPCHPRF